MELSYYRQKGVAHYTVFGRSLEPIASRLPYEPESDYQHEARHFFIRHLYGGTVVPLYHCLTVPCSMYEWMYSRRWPLNGCTRGT